jgi:alkylation response protein AidB-like acyl-CoA dehydrogenase
MRASLGDTQAALQDLARVVARDLGVTSTEQLPPQTDADRAWNALASSGLLDLRRDGAGVLELVLCAEAFGANLSAAPFVGASLAREFMDTTDERTVVSLDGSLAPDAFGATTIVSMQHGTVHASRAAPSDRTADRSRVAARATGSTEAGRANIADERFTAIAQVLFSADSVGTALSALEDAVAYACEREQFGVRIGTFQAIQHLLADAWVDLIAARNAVRAAAWRIDHGTTDAHEAAARAKLVTDEASRNTCEAAIQVLGGIGHTWEHLAGVRLRRVLVSRLMAQSSDESLLTGPAATAPTGVSSAEGFDLRDDATEAAFRSDLAAWLEQNTPAADWHRKLSDAGFVGVSMPVDAGGRGLPVTCDAILSEELGSRGYPPPPAIGHLAHALAVFGTPEQRRFELAPMLDGSVRWCQGFSEPGAGSDLAGIRTRAVADGDSWIVNGRKIWTSEAAQSQRIMLLCRTGDDPHEGLSVLLLSLDTPGIEVTTITTSWGSAEFAEVSFDDVRVSAEVMLGEPGQGWAIAMSLLAIERGPADIGWISRFRRTTSNLLDQPKTASRPDVQRAVAWLEALDATVAVTLTQRRDGTHQVAAGSIDKLLMTKVDQLLHTAVLDAAGLDALDSDSMDLERYLWARAASVFGGTSQIQRNIVAQRILGLPRG